MKLHQTRHVKALVSHLAEKLHSPAVFPPVSPKHMQGLEALASSLSLREFDWIVMSIANRANPKLYEYTVRHHGILPLINFLKRCAYLMAEDDDGYDT